MTRASILLSLAAVLGVSCAEAPSLLYDEPDDGLTETQARLGDVRIRLMAANITSGNDQAYHEPGTRIFKGLAPDIVMIQEFNIGGNSSAEVRAFVDQTFGPGFAYFREGGAQIPNGIISRWPIVESGEWTDTQVGNRDFAWARVDLPGPTDLYAVSVHLLSSSASQRAIEASSLLGHLQALPAGSYVVLGGDFNTSARDEACVTTLGQFLVTTGPFPADGNGNNFTNAARAKPYDWVLASSTLDARAVPVIVGTNTFSTGLVVDSRVYSPLSDIVPVQAGDSGATNMQHMAVVRDFVIPGDAQPDPKVTVTAPNGGETWAAGSTHDLTFTSTAVTSVRVEVTLDRTSYQTVAASVPASDGKVSWTVPATATTAGRVRVSEAATGRPSDTSDGTFTVTLPQTPPGKLFLNEILANEPGADQAGEFVEIVNGTPAEVSLAGYTISDARAVRHVFASGTRLASGRAIVVYGAASGIPAGVVAIGSSTGLLSLTNPGDTVTLADAGGAVVDRVTYGSSLAPRDGLSMNRNPDADPAGTFVLHDTIASAPASPGRRADGSAFGDGGGGGGGGGPITAESEPNDDATRANGPVAAGVAIAGAVATATDADWYRVTTTASGRLSISVAIGAAADLDWYLYREGSTSTYLARGYTTLNPEAGGADVAAGVYLIKVVGYKGAMSSYALTVTGALDR